MYHLPSFRLYQLKLLMWVSAAFMFKRLSSDIVETLKICRAFKCCGSEMTAKLTSNKSRSISCLRLFLEVDAVDAWVYFVLSCLNGEKRRRQKIGRKWTTPNSMMIVNIEQMTSWIEWIVCICLMQCNTRPLNMCFSNHQIAYYLQSMVQTLCHVVHSDLLDISWIPCEKSVPDRSWWPAPGLGAGCVSERQK